MKTLQQVWPCPAERGPHAALPSYFENSRATWGKGVQQPVRNQTLFASRSLATKVLGFDLGSFDCDCGSDRNAQSGKTRRTQISLSFNPLKNVFAGSFPCNATAPGRTSEFAFRGGFVCIVSHVLYNT